MAGMSSLTGGGGLSAGGGGPSSASSDSTSGFRSDFVVNFGGKQSVQLAPWIILGVVAVVWLMRKK